jgi:hypothetical protein
MHPARLALLASKHAPSRKVVSNIWSPSGTAINLECGHSVVIAPHFDCSNKETHNCRICGQDYVKSAPQYSKEF